MPPAKQRSGGGEKELDETELDETTFSPCLCCLQASALMQLPSARRLLLMLEPSRMRAPRLLVAAARSEPARSMSVIFATRTPALNKCGGTGDEKGEEAGRRGSKETSVHALTRPQLLSREAAVALPQVCCPRLLVNVDGKDGVRARAGGVGVRRVLRAVGVASLQHLNEVAGVAGPVHAEAVDDDAWDGQAGTCERVAPAARPWRALGSRAEDTPLLASSRIASILSLGSRRSRMVSL